MSALSATDITIYLVDDDRGMVSSTSQWLSLSGLRIKAFADPTALMKVVRAGHPCVVVSDIRMPGIDGMELMKLIRGRDLRIPVILITGHGGIPLAVEAMKAGAFEFLQKPFSPEVLLATVQRAQTHYLEQKNLEQPDPPLAQTGNTGEERPVETQAEIADLSTRVDRFERDVICEALTRSGGSISRAIEELGIPRRTLNAKMKRYGISRNAFR